MQLALLGSGDPDLQDRYQAVAKADAGRIAVLIGYDEALAHLIQAGADTIVVPSRFKTFGLIQLCALRYGAVPIVSRVGGLADTVIDVEEAGIAGSATTGLKFSPVTVENLASGHVGPTSCSMTSRLGAGYSTTACRRMYRGAIRRAVTPFYIVRSSRRAGTKRINRR